MSEGSAFGHHGHETKIKLRPIDFCLRDGATGYGSLLSVDGGEQVDYSGQGDHNFAQVLIPRGMKATHVRVDTVTTDANGLGVFVGDIDDGDVVSQLTDGSTDSEEALDAEVAHTDTNYLTIRVHENAGDIFGGYVLIAPI